MRVAGRGRHAVGRVGGDRVAGADRGSMAVEIVVLVPSLLLVLMLVVALGRYVTVEGDAQAAARDAVRAATFERDAVSAVAAARSTADASLPDAYACAPAQLEGAFVAGGTVTAVVACEVPWTNLGLIGLQGSASVEGRASAPLDQYRRVGAP